MSLKPKEINGSVKNVLLTFGGVDPNDFTLKTLKSISDYCFKNDIIITVILGQGYHNISSIEDAFPDIKIVINTKFISNYIQNADIIFSSAGRTTFEAASLGIPTIVLCQNRREITHFFAQQSNGFINLGLGTDEMLRKNKLRQGRNQVLKLIKKVIDE